MLQAAPLPPLLTALSFSLLLSTSASAFCGLQSCPRPAGSGDVPTVEAALRTRAVSYDIAGHRGSYVVTAPRVFLNYAGVSVGAEIPLTRLDKGGAIATGLSNPVVMARYARRLSYSWSGEVGLQWELPVGNRKDGLAGDHHMLLPWIGVRHDFMPRSGSASLWYATGMFGVSTALEEAGASAGTGSPAAHHAHHAHRVPGVAGRGEASVPLAKVARIAKVSKIAHAGHDHGTPVLVNPHADREAQARVAVGWTRGRGTLEGFGLAQYDLTDVAGDARTYARAGASYEWAVWGFTRVQVIADVPVTAARRNEREMGVTLKTGF